MSHSYHEPGKQLVFSDDCAECTRRVSTGLDAFAYLDDLNLSLLWTGNSPNERSTLDRQAMMLLEDAVLVANRIRRTVGA